MRNGSYIVNVVGADGRTKSTRTVASGQPATARLAGVADGDTIEVWAQANNTMSWDAARLPITR
jgi:hypothetical protein